MHESQPRWQASSWLHPAGFPNCTNTDLTPSLVRSINKAVWCGIRLIGNPARIRYGPATVNAESTSEGCHWGKPREGCSGLLMRQSGNRPDAHGSRYRLRREARCAYRCCAFGAKTRQEGARISPPLKRCDGVSLRAAKRRSMVTLILGGARSGKSGFAQALASKGRHVTFIGTARPSDAEMRRKIARHRSERPGSWKTIEAPAGLAKAIASRSSKPEVILIDCLTVYVDNLMNAGRGNSAKIQKDLDELCREIERSRCSIIVVSNEVGCGIVPAFRSGRRYRDILGRLNQRVAAIADRVILMVAGVPLTVKRHGRLLEV